ncbi:MAG: hypothetical protein J07HX64_00097 [halophilic archaeon J07HX64]|nr:MAG: hypothetical protein J07HX64_00097 [halophilic archaeon J07HX64]
MLHTKQGGLDTVVPSTLRGRPRCTLSRGRYPTTTAVRTTWATATLTTVALEGSLQDFRPAEWARESDPLGIERSFREDHGPDSDR